LTGDAPVKLVYNQENKYSKDAKPTNITQVNNFGAVTAGKKLQQ
jgi:hypothetical protein